MKPVRLLIIDDELPPSPEPSPERLSLLSDWEAEEVPIQEPPSSSVSDSKTEVALTTGEDEDGNYTFEAIREAITSGVGPEGWSLVLLDVTFGSKQHFGERVREKLLEEFPDLPLLLLTARAQYDLQNKDVPYLSKDELDKHKLIPELHKHGELTSEQRRALLHLEDEVAASPAMLEVFRQAFSFAASKAPVLLRGEAGAGKEILARYIHRVSARQGGPFVAENMAGVGASDLSLIKITLFGRRKDYPNQGDAAQPGLFGLAKGGTLFLDEVVELPWETQAMLLRVLQEEQYRREGDDQQTEADVRLLTATNRNIEQLVQDGNFRDALYDRIKGAEIHIPPLRDRTEDVVPLAEHFLRTKMKELNLKGVRWSNGAKRSLETLSFPGNVRQLEKLVQRILLEKGNNTLISEQDVRSVAEPSSGKPPPPPPPPPPGSDLTLSNLDQQLAALPVSKNKEVLKGSLRRLNRAVAKLRKRLAGAALESTRSFSSGELDRSEAVRLLQEDANISSTKATRTLCSILGENQNNSLTSEQVETLLNAWKQSPPNDTASKDSTDAS